MNKKIFILMIIGMFLILPVVSADKLTYSNGLNGNSDLKVTLSDTTLFGLIRTGNLGTLELKSHKTINEIKKVGVGNQVTMYYDFNFLELYENGLGNVEFTDMRTGKLINREYKYVYWGDESYEVPIYSHKLVETKNGTINQSTQIGTETKTRKVWLDYNSKDIPKGKIRIGIMVNNKQGDFIDGVWEIGDKKVNKHARWTANLNTGLDWYYKLDENTGTDVEDSVTGNYNTTFTGSADWTSGIINSAGEFSAIGEYINNTYTFGESFSFSAWVYYPSGSLEVWPVFTTSDLFNIHIDTNPDQQITMELANPSWNAGVVNITMIDDTWVHFCATYDGSTNERKMYVNGIIGLSDSIDNVLTGSRTVYMQRHNIGSSVNLDEIGMWSRSLSASEVTQLYNSGNGLGYLPKYLSISLNSPEDNFKSNNTQVTFNASVITTSSSLQTENVSLYLDGVLNETNSSHFNGTYIFKKNFAEGNYNWSIFAWNNESTNSTSDTRDFTVDTIPPTISITSPTNTIFDYLTYGTNFTLNTTINDTNLDTCWYNYNDTNTTFSCTSEVLKSQNLTITDDKIVIVYANDTVGHLSSESFSWTYDVFDFNDYTYDSSITEESLTTFSGKFKTDLDTAYLQYNNTNYSASINSLGNDEYIFSKEVTSPAVSSDTNVTWFFWINGINTTAYNQTVVDIKLDDCSSYTFYIVNYTLVDELSQENINNTNSTIESLVILKTISGEEISQFNKTFNGTATASICSETNLNSTALRLWEQSRYGSQDHVFEQHNIQNASMTSLPRKITLRDLPSTSATTFRIAYKSATFLPVPNAVVNIQRKYIGEGIFKTIESPLTDTSGETSASLDLNSVLYRIIVSKDGTTLATFENPAVACDNLLTGDCSIIINERSSVDLIDTYDVINDFSYGLYLNNRTITLSFEIPSGQNKLVNLFVNQSSLLGNKTSCNQTAFATKGQLQCVVSESLGDVNLIIEISSNGVLIRRATGTILEDRSQYFGTDNIVLTFFLVLSLVLLMISSPITVLIGLLIGLISSSLMLFLNAGTVIGVAPVLTYLIVIIILLITKISRRENK